MPDPPSRVSELQRPRTQHLQRKAAGLAVVFLQEPVRKAMVVLNGIDAAAIPRVLRVANRGQRIAACVNGLRNVNGAVEVPVSTAVMHNLTLSNNQHDSVPSEVTRESQCARDDQDSTATRISAQCQIPIHIGYRTGGSRGQAGDGAG